MDNKKFEENKDYYLDNGKVIMTENYHVKRGYCCGNKCRHCCFYPKYIKGNTIIDQNNKNDDIYIEEN
jgi:hypothetical protein